MVFGIKKNSTRWSEFVAQCPETSDGVQMAQAATLDYLRKKNPYMTREAKQAGLRRLVDGLRLPDQAPPQPARFRACAHLLDASFMLQRPDDLIQSLKLLSRSTVLMQCSALAALAVPAPQSYAAARLPEVMSILMRIASHRPDCFSRASAAVLRWAYRDVSRAASPVAFIDAYLRAADCFETAGEECLKALRLESLLPRLEALRGHCRGLVYEALRTGRQEIWQPLAKVFAEHRLDATCGVVAGLRGADFAAWRPDWPAQQALQGLRDWFANSPSLPPPVALPAARFLDYFALRLQAPPRLRSKDLLEPNPEAMAQRGLDADAQHHVGYTQPVRFAVHYNSGSADVADGPSLKIDPRDKTWPDNDCATFLMQLVVPLQDALVHLGRRVAQGNAPAAALNMLGELCANIERSALNVAHAQTLLQACALEHSAEALEQAWEAQRHRRQGDFEAYENCQDMAIQMAESSPHLSLLAPLLWAHKIEATEAHLENLCTRQAYRTLASYTQRDRLDNLASRELPPHTQAVLRWRVDVGQIDALEGLLRGLNASVQATAWMQALVALSGPAVSRIPMVETTDYASLSEHLCSSLQRETLLPLRMRAATVSVRLDPEVDSYANAGWSLSDLLAHAMACRNDPRQWRTLLFLLDVPELTQAAINRLLAVDADSCRRIDALRQALDRGEPTNFRACLQACGLWQPLDHGPTAGEADLAALLLPVLRRGRLGQHCATLALNTGPLSAEPEQVWGPGSRLLQALFPDERDASACPAPLQSLWRWRDGQPAGIALCRALMRDCPGASLEDHPRTHEFVNFLLQMQGPARSFSVIDVSGHGNPTEVFPVGADDARATSMTQHMRLAMPERDHLITVAIGNGARIYLHAENLPNSVQFLTNYAAEMVGGMLKVQARGQVEGRADAMFVEMFAKMQDTPCFDGKFTALEQFIDSQGLREIGNVDAMLDLSGKHTKETQAIEYLRVFRLRQAERYREENASALGVSPGNVMELSDFNDRYITRNRFSEHLTQSPWMHGRTAADLAEVLDYLIELVILGED